MLTPVIILCLLTIPLVLAWVICRIKNYRLDVAKYAAWGLGIAFVFFSIGHFVETQGMIEMLPSWVPFRLTLIYATGVLALMVGIALFLPRHQKNAVLVAVVLLIGFFPANVYAAFNSVGLGGHLWGPAYLLVRAPLQLILLAWAYFLCFKKLGLDNAED